MKSLKGLQSCWDRWQLGFLGKEWKRERKGQEVSPGRWDYRTGVAEKKANHGGIGQRTRA